MARPEPFRGLLDKAFALQRSAEPFADGAPPRRAPMLAVAPPPVLDDEHKATTLEQRLDAAILAGATPPHGLRPPRLQDRNEMVPLRLESPFERERERDRTNNSQPPRPTLSLAPVATERSLTERSLTERSLTERSKPERDVTRPAPRVLQFLPESFAASSVSSEAFGRSGDDSAGRLPRLEPVHDSQRLPVAVGVHTNVYRLRSDEDEDTPARPLPAVSLDMLADGFWEGALADETRKLRGRDKVMTRESLGGLGVDVRSFSSDDFDIDVDDAMTAEGGEGGFLDPDTEDRERTGRSPAAVALPALSDEMELDPVDVDFGTFDDLDELAAQLGLHGVSVPRSLPPQAPVADLDDLDELQSDDVELIAVASPSKSDPFGAVVMGRLAAMPELARLDRDVSELNAELDEDALDDDDGLDDDTEITPPRASISLLPMSLFDGADVSGNGAEGLAAELSGDDDGLDDDDLTPARASTRPAIIAPQAVRFVVADAPARPRHDALSAEEKLRNKTRARDLYLVAMDDLGDGDPNGAIVHLELAIAYDDETSLYVDLLGQLKGKKKRA